MTQDMLMERRMPFLQKREQGEGIWKINVLLKGTSVRCQVFGREGIPLSQGSTVAAGL